MQKSMLRLKGKHATFVVNPQDETDANAAFFLDDTLPSVKTENSVMIHGAGDYEIGGVKITGTRGDKGILYSLNIDGIATNAAFLTSLATNVIAVYGEKAVETVKGFEKENLQPVTKYSATAGKLPVEVEIVLLA